MKPRKFYNLNRSLVFISQEINFISLLPRIDDRMEFVDQYIAVVVAHFPKLPRIRVPGVFDVAGVFEGKGNEIGIGNEQ